MVSDEDRRQVDRLTNLVQAFDWTVASVDYTDDQIKVVLTRPVTGEPAETSAGPT